MPENNYMKKEDKSNGNNEVREQEYDILNVLGGEGTEKTVYGIEQSIQSIHGNNRMNYMTIKHWIKKLLIKDLIIENNNEGDKKTYSLNKEKVTIANKIMFIHLQTKTLMYSDEEMDIEGIIKQNGTTNAGTGRKRQPRDPLLG
jgi:hypothetical protein